MPELPEVESARQVIERAGLDRRIVAVDDSDSYECRPHAPGEIAEALVDRRLRAVHRRGKLMWCETTGRRSRQGDGPLKARLLDQSVLAGVGNLLADEVLWQAGLDPRRPSGELSTEELEDLRRRLRSSIRRAIRLGGVHTGEVVPHRGHGGHCPRCGAEMARATVGSRTTWFCPVEQH